MKGQRLWRTVSLENPDNRSIFNSGGQCAEIGLFEVIKFGLINRRLRAFDSDDFSQETKVPLTSAIVLQTLAYYDSSTVQTFDANGQAKEEALVTRRYLMGSDVKSYLIEEDWILNSYTGKQEKYIVALAPLVYDKRSGKIVPLFWLYYEEWKSLFSCFEARNFYSHERISFHTLLSRKYFISRLSKVNNVFDRPMSAESHGDDRKLNEELMKEKLNNAESDLFQH